MNLNMSSHAQVRAQQRGISQAMMELLLDYGEEIFDGHGGVKRAFNKRYMREIEDAKGRDFVRKCVDRSNVYLIESSLDSTIITAGQRTCRMRRP